MYHGMLRMYHRWCWLLLGRFRNWDLCWLLLPLTRISFWADARRRFRVLLGALGPASSATDTVIGATRGSRPGDVGFADG